MKSMLGFAACGAFGSSAGIIARSAYWHLMGVSTVTDETLVPIGILVAVAGTIGAGGWWAGKLIQRVTDTLARLEEKFDGLYCVKHNLDSCGRKEAQKK